MRTFDGIPGQPHMKAFLGAALLAALRGAWILPALGGVFPVGSMTVSPPYSA